MEKQPLHMSSADYVKVFGEQKKQSKFKAIRTTVDELSFASKKEANRYLTLKKQQQQGYISDLKIQPRWKFPNKTETGMNYTYIADFSYIDRASKQMIVEDVKGVKTPAYLLKKSLMLFFHNIKITEV